MINNFKEFLNENNIEYMKDLASRIRKFIDKYHQIGILKMIANIHHLMHQCL